MDLHRLNTDQLQQQQKRLEQQYQTFKDLNLSLDLTRGKPSEEQLDLSNQLDGILAGDYNTAAGADVRNYGGLDGIPELKQLAADILQSHSDQILIGGNSSLSLMFHAVMHGFLFGYDGADSAWQQQGPVKFICPVPGYDRHFAICEQFGIEMITVATDSDGPDMDQVEALLRDDAQIKGLWCVPKYSNPTGIVYSDDVVARIAKLGKIAGPGFRVFWDNAYAVHDLVEQPRQLASIGALAEQFGTQDSVIQFASTSKMTLAGAGVAFMAASSKNLAAFKQSLAIASIGPDKVNQLRHARLFADVNAVKAHMAKHAKIIKPRFEVVQTALQAAFGDNALGRWKNAEGGYFISFDTLPGLAQEVVQLCAAAGVKLTPAGATYPYGKDPDDSNIRLAPTVPTVAQLKQAMQVFTCAVQLASVKQHLAG